MKRIFYDPSSKHFHFISQGNRETNCFVSEAHKALGGAVEKQRKDAPLHKVLCFLNLIEREKKNGPTIKL